MDLGGVACVLLRRDRARGTALAVLFGFGLTRHSVMVSEDLADASLARSGIVTATWVLIVQVPRPLARHLSIRRRINLVRVPWLALLPRLKDLAVELRRRLHLATLLCVARACRLLALFGLILDVAPAAIGFMRGHQPIVASCAG